MNHLVQVVHLRFYHYFAQMLLTKTICTMYGVHMRQPLSCMDMHSAVVLHNNVYICV